MALFSGKSTYKPLDSVLCLQVRITVISCLRQSKCRLAPLMLCKKVESFLASRNMFTLAKRFKTVLRVGPVQRDVHTMPDLICLAYGMSKGRICFSVLTVVKISKLVKPTDTCDCFGRPRTEFCVHAR